MIVFLHDISESNNSDIYFSIIPSVYLEASIGTFAALVASQLVVDTLLASITITSSTDHGTSVRVGHTFGLRHIFGHSSEYTTPYTIGNLNYFDFFTTQGFGIRSGTTASIFSTRHLIF